MAHSSRRVKHSQPRLSIPPTRLNPGIRMASILFLYPVTLFAARAVFRRRTVLIPTMPSGGRWFDCWKSITAASVVAPKTPSGVPVANLSAANPFWRFSTAAPRSPRAQSLALRKCDSQGCLIGSRDSRRSSGRWAGRCLRSGCRPLGGRQRCRLLGDAPTAAAEDDERNNDSENDDQNQNQNRECDPPTPDHCGLSCERRRLTPPIVCGRDQAGSRLGGAGLRALRSVVLEPLDVVPVPVVTRPLVNLRRSLAPRL